MEISKDILDLLKKLNIKLPQEIAKHEHSRKKNKNKFSDRTRKLQKPITTDLSLHSGEIKRFCQCCGTVSITFVDYVKRDKEVGYCTRTVQYPSRPITRKHEYNVIKCGNCTDLTDKLPCVLIEMIQNLRNKINSEEKG